MLKLSRRKGETVFIGDDIRVTIQETKRGSVILGIDAPEEVCILREELFLCDTGNSKSNQIKPQP